MELISEDAVCDVCTRLLRRFLGCPDVPLPCGIVRSRWRCNQYVRGAYSYRTVEYGKLKVQASEIAEPLYFHAVNTCGKTIKWPAVLFAGEAYDPDYFSTVHGALRSGRQAADRIAQFWQNENPLRSMVQH